jgi:glutaredoxin-related protein
VAEKLENYHRAVVDEVRDAVATGGVVVVGMKHNPHVRQARKALDQAGLQHTYLEYGSYVSRWRERLSIKLWSGWPTFPQVFVRGTLVGGATDLQRALDDGSVHGALASD